VPLGLLLLLAEPVEPSRAENPTNNRREGAARGARPAPKPLTASVRKALAYLVSQQDASGGWGQGGGWRQNLQGNGRVEGKDVKDPLDLGNTCIATLALIRAENTPEEGPYAANVARALNFICAQIENSNSEGLYVTDVRDTQLQQKIGQYVDTFLAGLVLAELKGKTPNDERLLAALKKTVSKIERNQQNDGTFAGNTGWASVLSQGLASKFINRAAQNKVAVSEEVLRRDYQQTLAGLDRKTASPAERSSAGRVAGVRTARASSESAGDAGVELYGAASNAGRVSDFFNTNLEQERTARDTIASASATPADKKRATDELSRIEAVKGNQRAAVSGLVAKLGDRRFVAGFGNNGGEEFLSYMNISEMLLPAGGPDWEQWDKSVTANLERIQNQDGSWSGQHCITGRTFCTSVALLTLMGDRAPVPLAAVKASK